MNERVLKEKPLKTLIEASGYTLKDFALRIGVHYNSVKAYASGDKMPATDVTVRMAQVLHKPLKVVVSALGIDVSQIPDD
jgi:transcriptional regulator with XRE-family HTH domain